MRSFIFPNKSTRSLIHKGRSARARPKQFYRTGWKSELARLNPRWRFFLSSKLRGNVFTLWSMAVRRRYSKEKWIGCRDSPIILQNPRIDNFWAAILKKGVEYLRNISKFFFFFFLILRTCEYTRIHRSYV